MSALEVDIAIVGGGIAGLWLLSRLRIQGFGVLLIEADRLGAGQTIAAQGIIHGGAKYALTGRLSGATRSIGSMPVVWRHCLGGQGEVDLTKVRVLSEHQYLWSAESLAGRLTGFFASQAMRSRMKALAAEDFPAVFNNAPFRGTVYRLDEPVLDTRSLLTALCQPHQEVTVRGAVTLAPDDTITLHAPQREPLVIRAQRIVFTAGAGNQHFTEIPMQLRPLHMVMVRGEALPDGLYAHCLGISDTPRLTTTAHRDAAGQTVWYLGGQLAETGKERNPKEQIAAARQELTELLPWVDLRGVQFTTLRIDRAEARQPSGRRPDAPGVLQSGKRITAWPTKLAMAPMLADAVLNLLERDGIRPYRPVPLERLAGWPRPSVAAYPWDEVREWC